MDARQWHRMGGAAIAVLIFTSPLARADDGRPSQQVLEQMGLGGLVVLSDAEATVVRGQGFKYRSLAQAFGNSFATIDGKNGGAHSENAYNAEGKHAAKGSNSSYAGVISVATKGKHGKSNRRRGRFDPKPRGMGGQYGGGNNGGGYSQPGGGYHGGGKPRGGKISIKATIFFAGGHSSAWAF